MITNHQKIHGNLIPEGLVAPGGASWPSGAEDQQMIWRTDEQRFYVYNDSTGDWIPAFKPGELEPVFGDFVPLAGKTFAGTRAYFFIEYIRNRNVGGWTSLYQYCWWQFSTLSMGRVYTDPVKFASSNAFFDYLEALVPSTGGIYDEPVYIKVFEEIDLNDPFPMLVRHRNSLMAAIRGSHNWCKNSNPDKKCGVDYKFNAPSYYTNFFGELGRVCVYMEPGAAAPIANDDDVIWWHHGRRGLWRWPKVGTDINLDSGGPGSGAGQRRAWDSSTSTYVDAPDGTYVIENPFFIMASNQGTVLEIDSDYSPAPAPPYSYNGVAAWHRGHEILSPMVLVFPVVHSARYYGYVVVPHGSDTWFTEAFDLTAYELVVCTKFKHTFRKRYHVMGNPYKLADADKVFMWHLNPGWFSRMGKIAGWTDPSLDMDAIPFQIDMALRNKTTGKRSKWFPLFNITRRIDHAALRVDPAGWKR